MTRKFKTNFCGWAMITPSMVGIMIFAMIPIVMAFAISFSDMLFVQSGSFENASWVWFDQYRKVLTDPLFGRAIVNTFIAAISVPLQMVLGLLIALLLKNVGKKMQKFFQAVFFIPYVSSMVAVVYMWQYIFEPTGIINNVITAMGGETIKFLTDPAWFMPCIILMMTWSGFGYYTILYQAALTNVNQSCLEAAMLDGAGRFKRFFAVTLPLISPTTFYLLVMGIIGGLQAFTWFQIICANLGAGFVWGPDKTGITIVYYIYQSAYVDQFGMGGAARACAMSVVLVFIIGAFTVLNFALQRKWVHYDE